MLTARSVIIVVIVIAVLSILGGVYELMKAPGSEGLGGDSFGVRAHGQRAVFELLEELHIPVERGLVPPSANLNRAASLVLLDPEDGMVRIEPGFLKQVGAWVERGGTVLIAPGFVSSTPKMLMRGPPGEELSALEALGLKEIKLTKLEDLLPPPVTPPGQAGKIVTSNTDDGSFFSRSASRLETPLAFSISSKGADFERLGTLVKNVVIADDGLRVLDPTSAIKPQSSLQLRARDGKDYAFAALYALGKGRIIVVSDPSLFSNVLLGKGDNPVIAAHLLDLAAHGNPPVTLNPGEPPAVLQGGRLTLVFDEFYHGLTIRGNPGWLLTRFPYGLLAAVMVLVTLLWAWREAIHLGPPLQERMISRRTIAEYVHAMASLYDRGDCRPFILKQLRDGVLWKLRKQLRLAPKSENVADITRALGRKNAIAAEQLREAANDVERVLNGNALITEKTTLRAAQKISKCL